MTFLSWGKKSSKIKSFSGEDENHSVQTQGMKKRNHEIFGVFQKSGMKFLEIYLTSKFFFFRKIYFKKFLLQILENPKNFMISFLSLLGLGRNLFLLKRFHRSPKKDQVNSEDFILIRLFPRQNDFTVWNFPPINLLPRK